MYRSPREFEPLLPPVPRELQDALVTAAEASAALGAALHPITRRSLGAVLRQMNSYYSNLIEGHGTSPLDIERAVKDELDDRPERRALQLEHRAHVAVQELIEKRLATEPNLRICSAQFIQWIHSELYSRMPTEFRFVDDAAKGIRYEIVPGKLRGRDVHVGQHLPPEHGSVAAFLTRFEEVYEPSQLDRLTQLIATAASHHRLAWTHPFLDGNGRVARLFTHAYLAKIGLLADGLWTMSRGMARHRGDYFRALSEGDRHREGDTDGRGNLSTRGLVEFIRFFFATAHDQIAFMRGRLALDGLALRIRRFAERQEDGGTLPKGANALLLEALHRGEFERGEAARILGLSAASARRIAGAVIGAGLLASQTERGPLRLAFPVRALVYYVPELYPASEEAELL